MKFKKERKKIVYNKDGWRRKSWKGGWDFYAGIIMGIFIVFVKMLLSELC